MKQIRVLYYEYPAPGIGGSRRSLLNLIRGLGDHVQAYIMGDLPEEVLRELPETTVILPASSIWPPKRPESIGRLRRTLLWWCYFLGTAARLVWFILRYGIDVVHGNNNVTSSATAILAAKLTGRPCVCHLRGTLPPWRETRWLFRHVNHFIAICEYVRDYYANLGLLKGKNISVIYNGVDVGALQRASDRKPGIADGGFRVGGFGRIIFERGFDYFLYVAKETLKRTNSVEFVIYGPIPPLGHPNRSCYESLCVIRRRLGLENTVRFEGAYSDVAEVMQKTNVALCTCPTDNFGRILFEAMACDVPVVAFDVGGTNEVLESGVNGILSPNKDSIAAAKAIICLKEDEDMRNRIIRGGRDTARCLFDTYTNSLYTLDIYRKVLKRPKNSRA